MRARAAYISSFGTGGIIVASALLMLTMVSALVAFHAWPAGQTSGGGVSSVPLEPSLGTTTALQQVRSARPAPARVKAAAAHAPSRHATAPSTSGLLKVAAQSVVGAPTPGSGKVPTAVAPVLPPVQTPPPSTGPQRQSPRGDSPGGRPAHRSHRGPVQVLLGTLPPVQPPPGVVDGTTSGVVGQLPLPPPTAEPPPAVTLPSADEVVGQLTSTLP